MNYDIQLLSIDEKIKLAEELWESIEAERIECLSRGQQQLLEQRIMLHNQNLAAGKIMERNKKKIFQLNV